MKIARLLGTLLLALGAGCSKPQPKQEPPTITFLDVEWDTPDRLQGLGQDLQDFTEATGIRVKRIPRPDGSLTQLALWRKMLQQGGPTPDVVSVDVIWSGILNPQLMDLKPYFRDELSTQPPVVLASYTVGDKVLAVPRHAYIGVLIYRPDLLQKYGYLQPPKTWDELESMSARIQAGERAKGDKNFWGYVWQGGVDEDLTCGGLELQVDEGAGHIIEQNQTISVNNPQTVRAWQRAARWVGSISPPTVVAYAKWDSDNVWASGEAAFLRGWQSDFSLISRGGPSPESPSQSLPGTAPKFGVTSMPGGRAGRAGALGGSGLAVPRASKHPREAMELIRYLLRKDDQLFNSTQNATVPRDLQLFDLPSILRPYATADRLKKHEIGVVARPSVVSGEKYDQVSRAYIASLHSVLTEEKQPAAAAAELEKQLVEITGFRTGPPGRGGEMVGPLDSGHARAMSSGKSSKNTVPGQM
jgi:trehalose/maltose transport system substrate-binding protein